MAARSTAVAKNEPSLLPDSVLTQPCEQAQQIYKKLADYEERSRAEIEDRARTALAEAYEFGDLAFSNAADLEELRKSLNVEKRDGTSDYHYVVKVVFGEWEPEQKDGKTIYNWKPISYSQTNKYSKVMDFARYKGIAPADFRAWLDKDDDADSSINYRVKQANDDEKYLEDRKSRGLTGGKEPVKAIILNDEQFAMLAPRLVHEEMLAEAPEEEIIELTLRKTHTSGSVQYYKLPVNASNAQKLIDATLKVDDSEKPFKRLFNLIKLAGLVRCKQDEVGAVVRVHMDKDTKAAIAHNGLRGSVRIDIEHDTPDEEIKGLDTYLDKRVMDYLADLWKNFKGEWKFDPPHTIIVTPPDSLSVSARLDQINAERQAAAKKAFKDGKAQDDKYKTFSLPEQFKTVRNKTIAIQLNGWVDEDKVKLAEPQPNITYLPHQIVLDKDLIKKITDKEKDFGVEKHPTNKTKKGEPELRVKGSIYNFRITNSRLAFCDVDGDVVKTVDLTTKLGDANLRKNIFLYKRDLSKVLKTLQSIFKDKPIVWEISDSVFKFTVDAGTARASVVLPAAAPNQGYNSTAFRFESASES